MLSSRHFCISHWNWVLVTGSCFWEAPSWFSWVPVVCNVSVYWCLIAAFIAVCSTDLLQLVSFQSRAILLTVKAYIYTNRSLVNIVFHPTPFQTHACWSRYHFCSSVQLGPFRFTCKLSSCLQDVSLVLLSSLSFKLIVEFLHLWMLIYWEFFHYSCNL